MQEVSGLFHATPINASNGDGSTALHVAVVHGHLHLVKVLLSQGADPNLQTRSKHQCPLHIAAQNTDLPIMEALVSSGAKVDVQDICGNTALHHCSMHGFSQGTLLLLKYGAAKDIMNLSNNTPAQEAEEKGHWNIVEIIFGKIK